MKGWNGGFEDVGVSLLLPLTAANSLPLVQ